MLPPVAGVIFDLDGTLVESRVDLATAVNRTRHDLSMPPLPVERITTMVGDGARMLVRRALGDADHPELLERAFPGFLAHYRQVCLDTTRPYPGIEALLASLARAVPLAVLTNKPDDLTRRILQGLGLHDRFREIVAGDTAVARKPDPGGLLRIAEFLGLPPQDLMLVGDSSIDARTAVRAGCRLALVEWGFASPETLREFPAEIRAAGVEELRRALEARVGADDHL
jgi:phosphoglycolate phosphatase